jgi:hypothetical protein
VRPVPFFVFGFVGINACIIDREVPVQVLLMEWCYPLVFLAYSIKKVDFSNLICKIGLFYIRFCIFTS